MKFMNMKRFASVVMAGVMTLSLATSAFAADPPANTTVVTGTYKEIPIAVQVPTTGAAQINPYKLPVSVSAGEEKTVDLAGQQITTKPMSIKNQGAVKLDVNATLAVIPKGDVAIAAAKDTGKTMKVSLEVAKLDDTTLAVASDNENLENMLTTKFADKDTWTGATTLGAPAVAKGTTTVTPAKSNAAMAILGAATVGAESITYGKDSIALFRLVGDLAAEPEKADHSEDPWKDTDGFEATIVFKFTPHETVGASVDLDNTTLTIASGGTGTLTATFDPGETTLTVTKYEWTSDNAAATVARGGTATSTSATITNASTGSANITVTATLSDNSTVSATCAVTCS